jgi:hypothetical protein
MLPPLQTHETDRTSTGLQSQAMARPRLSPRFRLAPSTSSQDNALS